MTADIIEKLQEKATVLTQERKKRGKTVPEGLATADSIKQFVAKSRFVVLCNFQLHKYITLSPQPPRPPLGLCARDPRPGHQRGRHGQDRDRRRGQERHRVQQEPGAGRGRAEGPQQEGECSTIFLELYLNIFSFR